MRLSAAAALVVLVLLAACGGDAPTAAPTPTATPSTTPTPSAAPTPTLTPSPTAHGSSDLGPVRFDAARAFAHVEALAVDIGSRPVGSEAERQAAVYLRDQLQSYGYEVDIQPFSYETVGDAGSSLDSQNVVARPEDGECRVIAGGHYDSVPAGPGANDNASGAATVVEIARVLAADGELDDVCFLLFGAEEVFGDGEVGLIGSAHFVESLSPVEEEALEAMLNFDMVGVGTQWLLAGSPGMIDLAATAADERGLDYIVDRSPSMGSDHASFINGGIPAVLVHSLFVAVADDPNYHTAGDRAEHVEPSRMAEVADLGLDVIDALLSGR